MRIQFQQRHGATLTELLIFLTIAAMMSATVLPFLFTSTESRQRQDAIALVEQNGAQMLQVLTQEIRDAERILDPPIGGTGYILALKTSSGSTNPTLFARQSGALVMIQGSGKRLLSSDLVGVTSFVVDNTSNSADRQSAAVSFGVRRTIRLHQPLVYTGFFEAVVTLFPDDDVWVDGCSTCTAPTCNSSGAYFWYTCEDTTCVPQEDFQCVYES